MRLIKYVLMVAAIAVVVVGFGLLKWSPDPSTQVFGLAVAFIGSLFLILATFIPTSHGLATGY